MERERLVKTTRYSVLAIDNRYTLW